MMASMRPATNALVDVSLIGDFSDDLDEGYKNTSHYLASALEDRCRVIRLNGKAIGRPGFWQRALSSKAQIIHVIAQPTNLSFACARMLKLRTPGARTVVSALRADRFFVDGALNSRQRQALRLLKPDLVLVQNRDARRLFAAAGCVVGYLPNGVDLDRFSPASAEVRARLRAKYGLPPDQPIALHVGHLAPERNLSALEPLVGAGFTVLVAGSLYLGVHADLIDELRSKRFHVISGYQPNVEELYQLADCYVFPVRPGNSLSMPLSVLEAMACDLPVVTTRFPGLVESFTEDERFRFIDETSDIVSVVGGVLRADLAARNRDKVQPLSWQAVANQLHAYYGGLLTS